MVPYLTLLPLDAGQRRHDLREIFNGLHFVAFACLMLHRVLPVLAGVGS